MFADRGGWTAALEDAGRRASPTATVRIVAADKKQAIELAAALRAQGLLAAHAGNRNWVEVHAELSEVKRAIRASHQGAPTVLTIWDPARKRLEHLEVEQPLE